MNIIKPKVELLLDTKDNIHHVARCARVCYRKDTGNDNVLYNHLDKVKHWSMFRHETYYAVIPYSTGCFDLFITFFKNPYIKFVRLHDKLCVITNGHFIRNLKDTNPSLYSIITKYLLSVEKAQQIEVIWKNYFRYTFKVTTQVSTSRELNRVSPNNIAEQSTRYVYEDGTLCAPHWITDEELEYFNNYEVYKLSDKTLAYLAFCNYGFTKYKELINKYGMHRQDARGVLPFDTATKVVYTYSIDEWRHIIDLRYYGTTGKPHPNAKIIAGIIKEQLEKLGYDFK